MTEFEALDHTDHDQPYSDHYLRTILNTVKTIAMVGASPKDSRPSHRVLRFLHESGYDMIPVNPRSSLSEIYGLDVYPDLASIDRPVDMVQVFRRAEHLPGIAQAAADISARVLWGQLGVSHPEAARIAEAAGMKVVMNRCPKIEHPRLF